jgi:hypothetical protein
MPKFNVTLAFDVSFYTTMDIEAPNEAEAIRLARTDARDAPFTPDWDSVHAGDSETEAAHEIYRVVAVETDEVTP